MSLTPELSITLGLLISGFFLRVENQRVQKFFGSQAVDACRSLGFDEFGTLFRGQTVFAVVDDLSYVGVLENDAAIAVRR
jgi:hypothetical protein